MVTVRRPTSQPSNSQTATVVLSQNFKLILRIVTGLTVLSLSVSIGMSFIDGDAAENVSKVCLTSFQMGFGALVGLIGGKAL